MPAVVEPYLSKVLKGKVKVVRFATNEELVDGDFAPEAARPLTSGEVTHLTHWETRTPTKHDCARDERNYGAGSMRQFPFAVPTHTSA